MTHIAQSKPRILITDDEAGIRQILREMLGESYECAEACSAEEAIELMRAEEFDLLLTDIMMTGLSGLEMVPQVLKFAPDTTVIMISGEQTIDSAINALRAGALQISSSPSIWRKSKGLVM